MNFYILEFILLKIEELGFIIVMLKEIIFLREQVEVFYVEYKGLDFFEILVENMIRFVEVIFFGQKY